jgi:Lipid A 3-O-deacylase (PagL)
MKTSERRFVSARVCALFLFALALRAPGAAAQERAAGEPFDGEEIAAAAGQSSGSAFGLEKSANEFGVWGGGSLDSPTLIGKFENARLGLIGVRYARVLARGENVTLKYTSDAVPVAFLSFPDTTLRGARRTIYGAGLSPVGFQVNFRRRERVQPFAQASGGFLYFSERVPDESGAQFNFTADFGGGIQVKTGARKAWTFGYRYHHISNAYRASQNPGFDSNLFYVGFSFFR